MKILRKIKLINWHYFANETITLQGSALLTGENGSGKSTILDALQFLLVGDSRKVRFNQSAHAETRRDLKGYLRCKTGHEGSGAEGYLRHGDFTSYIVLEFYDTRKKQPFLLGTVIDSYASGEHDPPRFFKIEDCPLEDHLFLDGNRPRNFRELKAYLSRRKGVDFYHTGEQWRTHLLAKLGHLSERFFSLLVKALSFTPITNIRQFVYDYILEENPINIEAMLDNLQQYRQLEALLVQTREKIARLEEINNKYREIQEVQNWIRAQDYIILRARVDEGREKVASLAQRIEELALQIGNTEKRLAELADLEDKNRHILETLIEARAHNAVRLTVEHLEREIQELEKQGQHLAVQAAQLIRWGQAEKEDLETAWKLAREQASCLGLNTSDLKPLEEALPYFEALAAGQQVSLPGEDYWRNLALRLKDLQEQVAQQSFLYQQKLQGLEAEKVQLQEELESLRKSKLVYDKSVTELRKAIAEEVKLGGEPVVPQVLCELLEIPNEKWQNAVEGYLNTQRFDLLVPPEAFDHALKVYEKRKYELRLSGVGLVNTGQVLQYLDQPIAGSLAEEVMTDNPYARGYINRLLGQVMKCESEQELKRHRIAITPTCMTYRNHTARQINFEVYRVPFIGQRALKKQRELKEARLAEVLQEIADLEAKKALCLRFLNCTGDKTERYSRMWETWMKLEELPGLQDRLATKRQELSLIDRTELEELEARIRQIRKEEENLRQEQERLQKQLGSYQADLRHLKEEEKARQEEGAVFIQQLEQFAQEDPQVAKAGENRYQEERRKKSNREIIDNFSLNRAGNLTRVERLKRELIELKTGYNNAYQFGGAPVAEDNAAYEAEYRKLVESELPEYEERISQARTAAEQEFKEHFVYKLREQIYSARRAFQDLNIVLNGITFGQDRYQFVYSPAKDLEDIYVMIMDQGLEQGLSLFSQVFQEKHKAALEELFSQILEVPEEEQAENIRRFTDYRTYLDYDIKIYHQNGDVSLFSKVCREKSGGETQTPYYVAIVASFLQLYCYNTLPEDSIRLVMFDEAFNRMDSDRIENTLLFINKLGLQLLAAAPTEKCELITPHVPTTILVLREGHHAWTVDYHQALKTSETALAEVAATEEKETA